MHVSQRVGRALGLHAVSPKEREALARATMGLTTFEELPIGAQALVEAIEERPLSPNAMPEAPPAPAGPAKKPLTAGAPLYGLIDIGPEVLTAHMLCDLLTFCRNPLHPGPCKGWKHSLRAVAPGLHATMERVRLAKVDARRAAAGVESPRVRPLQHERAAAFWRKQASPAPLKAGEHRPLTAPDGTRAEIFHTAGGATVQVRDGAGVTRADLTRTFPTETQALAHLGKVAGKLADEQARGGTGPGRAEGGAPVIPAERQRRLDAVAARTKAAFDRKGQGKGRDGDGDGKKGEGDGKGSGVRSTRTSDGKGAGMETKVTDNTPDPNYVGPGDAVLRKAELVGKRVAIQVPDGLKTRRVEGVFKDARHTQGGTSSEIELEGRVKPIRLDGGLELLPDKPKRGAPAPKPAPEPKKDDGLDRYRTTPEEYRNHFDGYTDNELKRAAQGEHVATQGRARKEIIADLAEKRAAQDRKVLEQNLADRAGGSGGGSTETRPVGVGGNAELTEITGKWKGRKTPSAKEATPAGGPAVPAGGWRRNPLAYDPAAQMRQVKVDGKPYQVTNLGAGRSMNVKDDSGHIGMADWENWDQVAAVVRKNRDRKQTAAPDAAAEFRRGVPEQPDDVPGVSPAASRLHAAQRKIAAGLSKDLGESGNDWAGDVSPAARDWYAKTGAADAAAAKWRGLQNRRAWAGQAAALDPANADAYHQVAEQARADADVAAKDWDAAIADANTARDSLADAVIARYKAKGKRKTAAGLKLPDARKETILLKPTDGRDDLQAAQKDIQEMTDGFADHPDVAAAAAELGHAAVEAVKARNEHAAAHGETYEPRRKREELLRTGPGGRDADWEKRHAAAYADQQRVDGRANRADMATRKTTTARGAAEEKLRAAVFKARHEKVTAEIDAKRAREQASADAEVNAVRRPLPARDEPIDAQIGKVAELAATVKGFKEFENTAPYVIHDGRGGAQMTLYSGATNRQVAQDRMPPPERVLNYDSKRGWSASNGQPIDDDVVPYYIAEWNTRDRNTRNPLDMVDAAKRRKAASDKARAS